ncbi:hypothetical protein ANO11243_031150 [Dothideomycetidae sp. 11243]|nr:hypothetical protein ANO11243_031150 [fungal sp. No.11243]
MQSRGGVKSRSPGNLKSLNLYAVLGYQSAGNRSCGTVLYTAAEHAPGGAQPSIQAHQSSLKSASLARRRDRESGTCRKTARATSPYWNSHATPASGPPPGDPMPQATVR